MRVCCLRHSSEACRQSSAASSELPGQTGGIHIFSVPVSETSQPAPASLNVLGDPMVVCGCNPMTGWFRDGHCRTNAADLGRHSVCCVVNDAFLRYSQAQGNDLSTPAPAYGFPGLKPGDHWCVCAPRWLEAYEDGMAPPVRLEATEDSALEVISLTILQANAA